MLKRFQATARNIPLLGGLADCSWDDHWESIRQTFVVLLMSTAPIWLAAIIVYGKGQDLSYPALRAAFVSTIADGELFMFSTALLAPVFWMALCDPPGARVFPSKMAHMVLIVIIDSIAAVFFGLLTAHSDVNQMFVFRLSCWMFGASVILLYLGTVYHTSRLDVPGEFKRQEDSFSADYDRHRQ